MATLRHRTLAALAIAASACRISTGFGVAHPASPQAVTTSTSATSAATERSTGRAPADDPRIIFRAEMAALVGLGVDQARRQLAGYGHVGTVTVEELSTFDPACPLAAVCSTNHQGGSFIDAEIVLRVNKATLAIPGPPP